MGFGAVRLGLKLGGCGGAQDDLTEAGGPAARLRASARDGRVFHSGLGKRCLPHFKLLFLKTSKMQTCTMTSHLVPRPLVNNVLRNCPSAFLVSAPPSWTQKSPSTVLPHKTGRGGGVSTPSPRAPRHQQLGNVPVQCVCGPGQRCHPQCPRGLRAAGVLCPEMFPCLWHGAPPVAAGLQPQSGQCQGLCTGDIFPLLEGQGQASEPTGAPLAWGLLWRWVSGVAGYKVSKDLKLQCA